MGVDRILKQHPHDAPKTAGKTRTQPPCHTACRERRRDWVTAYLAFVAAYRAAFQALCAGHHKLDFPTAGVPPGGLSRAAA